jgi:hypothetical protein
MFKELERGEPLIGLLKLLNIHKNKNFAIFATA